MKPFTSSRRFRREYDHLFRTDPTTANVFLLMAEMANERGEVRLKTAFPEIEIQKLMAARFEDCRAYQLPGGPRR